MDTGKINRCLYLLLPVLFLVQGAATLSYADSVKDDVQITDPYSNLHYIRALSQQGKILPIQELLKMAMLDIHGTMIEIDLEMEGSRLVYEIEYVDDQGIVREAYFNAGSGQPISSNSNKAKR